MPGRIFPAALFRHRVVAPAAQRIAPGDAPRRQQQPFDAAVGADGLDAYRAIVPAAARLLAPNGILAVEIGATQGPAVDALMAAAGLMPLAASGRVWPDLSGLPRCVAAMAH